MLWIFPQYVVIFTPLFHEYLKIIIQTPPPPLDGDYYYDFLKNDLSELLPGIIKNTPIDELYRN